MIRAELIRRGTKLRLELEGHAYTAESGRDPVCAAASALTWAVIGYTGRLYECGGLERAPQITAVKGQAFICMGRQSRSTPESLTGHPGSSERALNCLRKIFRKIYSFIIRKCRVSDGREEIHRE